jgi:hypothetical protein
MVFMTTDSSDQPVAQRLRVMQVIPFFRRHVGLFATMLIGLTGLILTILNLLPETTELSYTVTRTSLLTKQPAAEGLVGEYYFEDKQIEQLWQIEVELENTGDRTLVGQGQIANVLNEGIAAELPASYRVLRAEAYRNDPDVTVLLDGERGLTLSFAQWRSGEVVELALYVETALTSGGSSPEIIFGSRQLVDGEIVRTLVSDATQARSSSLFDRFGGVPGTILRVLGSIVLGVLAFISGVFFVLTLKDYHTASTAQSSEEYGAVVVEWLSAHPELDEGTREQIRATAGKPGKLFSLRMLLDDTALTPDLIETFPRFTRQPMLGSHRARTIAAMCGGVLCTLFVMLAVELIMSIRFV